MTDRMTDERLAEIKSQLPPWRTQPRYAFAKELVAELEAEREKVKELEHDIDQYREIDKDHLKRIAELEAENAELEADNTTLHNSVVEKIEERDTLKAKLARVESLPRYECRVIAEFGSHFVQEEPDEYGDYVRHGALLNAINPETAKASG